MNLNSIRKNIQEGRVSMDEIIYLQDHKNDIKRNGDIELAQWAGISEDEWNK